MKNAFLQWQTQIFPAVWFAFVGYNKRNDTDITVHFVKNSTICGHMSAIGIAEDSQNPNSVMYTYPINDKNITKRLTDVDLRFVYNVYRKLTN